MEFTDIKIFKEVADLKSTMKAAESLGYVQSNISKRVAKLEEEIGKKLFHRTNKGMTLTTDGEEFLPYAEALLRTITDLEKNFIAVPKKIRVGATQTITKNYLQDRFFDEQLVIFTNTSSKLIQRLKNHQLDVMILNKKLEEKSFIRTKIKEEPISWIKSNKISRLFKPPPSSSIEIWNVLTDKQLLHFLSKQDFVPVASKSIHSM